jgi:hypothetical protein
MMLNGGGGDKTQSEVIAVRVFEDLRRASRAGTDTLGSHAGCVLWLQPWSEARRGWSSGREIARVAAESNIKQKQRESFAMGMKLANNVGEMGVPAVSKAQAAVRVARCDGGRDFCRCQRLNKS